MLFHYSSQDYNVAASAAATHARTKLEGLIEQGRGRAQAVFQSVLQDTPTDMVVPARRIRFEPQEIDYGRPVKFALTTDDQSIVEELLAPLDLHNHALIQVGQRAALPKRYINELTAKEALWARTLLAHNLNTLYAHVNNKYLVRTLGTEIRGFLSDKFRRLDSRPIFEAFINQCGVVGAVPVQGYALQTKNALKAILPMVFEPVNNEVLAYGVMIANSDYGDGALVIKSFVLRLWCTNYMIATDALRQVHLGKRLSENIQFSEETYSLDTAATVSAVNDIMRNLLSPENVNRVLDGVRAANEQKISSSQMKSFLQKHCTTAERKAITDKFSSADIELLPPGQTTYRFSNALSWFAGEAEDDRRRLELQDLAGKVMDLQSIAA